MYMINNRCYVINKQVCNVFILISDDNNKYRDFIRDDTSHSGLGDPAP